MKRISLVLAVLALVLSSATAFAINPFYLARKPNQTVVVTIGETPPTEDELGLPPMMQRLHGVLGRLSREQVVDLYKTVRGSVLPRLLDEPAKRLCVFHISGPAGKQTVTLEQTSTGVYIATAVDVGGKADKMPMRAVLKPAAIEQLLCELPNDPSGYLGSYDGSKVTEPKGADFEVDKPYEFGVVELDRRNLTKYLGEDPDGRMFMPQTSRKLEKETFFARLPKGYDPRIPAGLVVWLDPTASGRPPQSLWAALDKYGFICIGAAGAGNDRLPVADRLQLGLDAVSTARRRWHIDTSRVYAVGMSGGGRITAALMACFPDVYAGSVEMCGMLGWYRPATEGLWPALYVKPAGKRWELLTQRRIAAVTGSKDFNHDEVVMMTKSMQAAGMSIKLYDIEGMPHTMPPSAMFVEEFGWVDEVNRTKAEALAKEALAALEKAKGDRAALLEVVRKWPWTPAAWKAVDALSTKKEG